MRDEADASRGSRSRATTKSSEDYLEAILVIRRLRGSCRNVDIAERLGVSKASVTKALGNLTRRGLAEVVGRDVRLTEEGGRLAEATLAKHRFFERLLANAGVNAEVASKEACRMEHCISTDSFEKLSSHLGRIQDSLR
ncbi:metal-dependent transcriptional regulator [Adlercreutzia equolifaciens]|uniref:metal-dependent transcriptional regulator n=1 Tax=Adlercreutzia TaxID=447020 RepID=UPI001D096BED|nr:MULTISPECIES: metal-dependent transcriptional regulator [Adlercreutzia]MCB6761403.1 metal-dependent transcriptional regulator [Adlercreutzia equolifaciens]MCB6977135.1 metal-dependent transcriptional regulator [Adlercreutzia equolifaciens]MCQ5069711.1 metal-dependent transcriptional regulator [Adlercreutzia sp. DFI.6.23]MDE8685151.1 metal-dependent transcriptional regulator [Adlercreutzia rubneri]